MPLTRACTRSGARTLSALAEGEAEAGACFERIAPDLVVEVEITHVDEGKAERYGEMGVRQIWRLHGRKGARELRAEFLALRPGSAPRRLDASVGAGGAHAERRVRGGGRGSGSVRPPPSRSKQ